ncbi:MAG: UDP-4-amino-4,6-dideoxy-N-acetyl-beta-L-altrosamine transaminase [Endomicrobiales bacterium]|nr:UDP-4-amino-4,6-dideoxy-N-acetyl-beta-L-altrosamine transaminase [Endomicrobiales bacterium]
MKKKFIPYGHQWIGQDDIKAVVKALKSDWLTQGPLIKAFEDAVCKYTGAKYAVAVANGTAALHVACLAAGLGRGDEGITSPITFVASANCMALCGARPVLADIDPDTLNIDPGEVEKKVTERTKVLIPVHFTGRPCDMERISLIAKKRNIKVIEDAAHALGSQYRSGGRWMKVGSCEYSDMAILSFHPVKHITTGEGGMVLTNNKEYYEQLMIYRTHGITKSQDLLRNTDEGEWYYEMQKLGLNYRITDFQCALGIEQLKKLERFVAKRRELVKLYGDLLAGSDKFTLVKEPQDTRSSYHLFVIMLKNPDIRKQVYREMRSKGIGLQVHYVPVHLHPYYTDTFGYRHGDYPNAEKYYRAALTLPLFPAMTRKDAEYVVKTLNTAVKKHE